MFVVFVKPAFAFVLESVSLSVCQNGTLKGAIACSSPRYTCISSCIRPHALCNHFVLLFALLESWMTRVQPTTTVFGYILESTDLADSLLNS